MCRVCAASRRSPTSRWRRRTRLWSTCAAAVSTALQCWCLEGALGSTARNFTWPTGLYASAPEVLRSSQPACAAALLKQMLCATVKFCSGISRATDHQLSPEVPLDPNYPSAQSAQRLDPAPWADSSPAAARPEDASQADRTRRGAGKAQEQRAEGSQGCALMSMPP
jgi:hypothetical protein